MKLALALRCLTALAVLPLVAPALPATAAPLADGTLCHRVYLPLTLGGGGGVPAPAPQPFAAECQGFPDFNGDGYADLVIGVPNKEVHNGVSLQTDVGLVHVIYGSPNGLDAGAGQTGPDDQIWHRAVGGVSAAPGDAYGQAVAAGDFNGDHYDDLAIGIPGANIDSQDNAGAVQIIWGAANGLSTVGIQEWSRASDNVLGTPAAGDAFGTALAAGDFNGDGHADLAIGAPYAEVNGDVQAGAVHILFGYGSGLVGGGSELLTQDTPGFVASPAELGDEFGYALAAGDFNNDGVADLAVGTPFEDNGASYSDAGAVQVFFGQGTGPDRGLLVFGSVVGPQHWTADSDDDVEGVMEANDRFGYALAAGDFDDDGYADLAVGIPHENHGSGGGTIVYGGAVNILPGSAAGLAATPAKPARLWHQDVTNVADEVEANELFGHALAAGDFDGDGFADLAVGVPGEQTFDLAIGAVHLLYGGDNGVTANYDTLLYDPDNPEAGDLFGRALMAGDFDGNGRVDLAVGATRDDPIGVTADNSGSVFAFYSDATGLQLNLNQNWYAGHVGLKGAPADDDEFGSALPSSPDRP